MSERIWLLESLYKRIDRDPYTCTLYVATVLTGNINVTKHVSRFVKGSTNLRQIQAELRDHLDAINFPKKKKNSEPFTSAQIHRETMEVVRYRSLGKKSLPNFQRAFEWDDFLFARKFSSRCQLGRKQSKAYMSRGVRRKKQVDVASVQRQKPPI